MKIPQFLFLALQFNCLIAKADTEPIVIPLQAVKMADDDGQRGANISPAEVLRASTVNEGKGRVFVHVC